MNSQDLLPRRGSPSQCGVCGAPATGLHYGVMACEGCKVFFKRYLNKHQHYQCFFGGACTIDILTRSLCKACRFNKCVKEGMSVAAIRLGRTPKMLKTASGRLCKGSFGDRKAASSETSVIVQLVPRLSDTEMCDTADRSECLTVASPASSCPATIQFCPEQIPPNGTSRQLVHRATSSRSSRRSISSFSDENLCFMLSDFIGDSVRACRVPEIRMPASNGLQQTMEPSTLQKYWGVIRARNGVLEDSITAVSTAMDLVFRDQIRLHEEYLEKWYRQGLVPYQPQCSVAQMVLHVQGFVADFAQRLLQFAALLPGFPELGQSDRAILVRDRWYATWMVARSCCYRDNECYHPIGPFRFHCGRYWMVQLLPPQFVQSVFAMTAEVNELHLSLTERSLLMAVAFFRIDSSDTIEDKAYIDFLYTHYLDALIHLIGPGRNHILPQLRAVIKRFSIVNEVHRRFILHANLGEAPFSGEWKSDDLGTVIDLDPAAFARTDFTFTNF